MISREEALELLKKEGIDGVVLRHSFLVNSIANYIADELVEMGLNIDIDLVDVGSLLHDIGRGRDHKEHNRVGAEIMREMGENNIARIISVHSPNNFEDTVTLEEKIVNYSDKRVKHDSIVSLDDRMKDLVERYPHYAEALKVIRPKLKEFEDEVFGIIGEGKRSLESLKK